MRRMKNSCMLVGRVSAVFFGTASASAGVLEVGPGKANLSDPVWIEGVSGHRFFKVFIERN